eukprot:gnl/TRDRNA2_/TRDRNA2_40504_c0_seq1.p1 gnl/TRDRNA2_/TRDRNA2_40504_c0~~gnl/TRDRNA2_/TRDRNA2_40504_c0_seq1.p1  ORF type:complete len:301 (-),score=20.13 gnl/TRDRNA2_/TRDRNA2_40504_c0_seq1:107-1009(-)
MSGFGALIVSCSLISAVACLCLLIHLFRLDKEHRRRLFWGQLVALAGTDLLHAFLICTFNFAADSVRLIPTNQMSCSIVIYARYCLEFSSVIFEVQIAAGFAAACCHASQTAAALYFAIPLGWLGGGTLCLLAVVFRMRPIIGPDADTCYDRPQDFWGFTVLCCCIASSFIYITSIVVAIRSPQSVQRRAFYRAFWYTANFLCTFSLRAFTCLMEQPSPKVDQVAWVLVCLNGAVNTCTYMVQSQFLAWRLRRVRQLEIQVGFSQEVEVHTIASDASSCESGPDRYFDVGRVGPAASRLG